MKICPKCGGKNFSTGYSFQNSIATIDFTGDEFVFTPESGNETKERKICTCLNCGAHFDLTDEATRQSFIHQLKECKTCGNKVPEEELDENGVCIVCRLKEADPSFANIESITTDFNMIRMMASLRMDNLKLSRDNEKLKKEIELSKVVQEKIDNASTEATEKSEEQVTEEPKKRGRKKKPVEGEIVREEQQNNVVDVDQQSIPVDNDIQIDENVAPEMPQEVVDLQNAMNPPEEV
jgi:hypothetical protein